MCSAGMRSGSSAGIEGATATIREPSIRMSPRRSPIPDRGSQDGRAVNEDPLHGPAPSLARRQHRRPAARPKHGARPACLRAIKRGMVASNVSPFMAGNTMRRVIVIGGSLGGLFAGATLLRSGWDVTIVERSGGRLEGRGAGLGVHPPMLQGLLAAGARSMAVSESPLAAAPPSLSTGVSSASYACRNSAPRGVGCTRC